jgi:hypothetical protein
MHFPFQSGGTYTVGELRAFESQLSEVGQKDRDLRKAWRVGNDVEMNRRIKIREETYPIKLFADRQGLDDNATFSLKPYAHPGIDAEICSAGERFNLQITIADPVWSDQGDAIQHGGYDHRLAMEELNRQGMVFGSGPFRRSGNKIVSESSVKSLDDGPRACMKGLLGALTKKAGYTGDACRLLIFARGFYSHTIDTRLEDIVHSSLAIFHAGGGNLPFEWTYVVDEASAYVAIPPDRRTGLR